MLYHPEQKTGTSYVDVAENFVKQFIFEKIHKQVPYQVVLRTIGWTQYLSGTLRIDMELFVERESVRGIVCGQNNLKHIKFNAEALATEFF